MSVNYAPDVRNGGSINPTPEGFTTARWHLEASADTGTSHTLPGRLYLVQCEWCPEAFAAYTKGEALRMFRAHEEAMSKEAQK